MSTADDVVEVEGRPADPADVFLVEWAQETARRNVPLINEALARLVTLDATLLAGTIAFLKEGVPEWAKSAALLCFFVSLLAALWGMLPFPGTEPVSLFDPAQIRSHKGRALAWKTQCLRWAVWPLAAGLGVAVVGYLAR